MIKFFTQKFKFCVTIPVICISLNLRVCCCYRYPRHEHVRRTATCNQSHRTRRGHHLCSGKVSIDKAMDDKPHSRVTLPPWSPDRLRKGPEWDCFVHVAGRRRRRPHRRDSDEHVDPCGRDSIDIYSTNVARWFSDVLCAYTFSTLSSSRGVVALASLARIHRALSNASGLGNHGNNLGTFFRFALTTEHSKQTSQQSSKHMSTNNKILSKYSRNAHQLNWLITIPHKCSRPEWLNRYPQRSSSSTSSLPEINTTTTVTQERYHWRGALQRARPPVHGGCRCHSHSAALARHTPRLRCLGW